MPRSVAQRASVLFALVAAFAVALGAASAAPAAEALFMVAATLAAVTGFFGFVTSEPARQLVPVRIRRTRRS
jgi:hypothetical protein